MGDINALLRQQISRWWKPFLQGQYVVTVDHGTYGTLAPYHTSEQGYGVRGPWQALTLFAPTVPYGTLDAVGHLPYGSSLTTSSAPYSALRTSAAGNIGHGQAPTSGIYTGVEDHCD